MTHVSEITPYWVDTTGLIATEGHDLPRLAIVPCPPGGEHLQSALHSLSAQGLRSLVSLLQPNEAHLFGLDEEADAARLAGINYYTLPVMDHSIPNSVPEFRRIVDQLHSDLRAGRAVGAHCFAGIGRSCMLMACLLCVEGLQPAEAFARLSAARGLRVPDTWLQTRWVEHFAASLTANPRPAGS
jgi:protein tyrosine phosphatase (PTP) superfamily phosphohydrolase (DUF442 family)